MAVLCVAAEHGGLIKKEEKKVHRKNLRPNVGRPKNP